MNKKQNKRMKRIRSINFQEAVTFPEGPNHRNCGRSPRAALELDGACSTLFKLWVSFKRNCINIKLAYSMAYTSSFRPINPLCGCHFQCTKYFFDKVLSSLAMDELDHKPFLSFLIVLIFECVGCLDLLYNP